MHVYVMFSKEEITFGDFFAGIGGFRIGLESLGWKCKYSCEIDEPCVTTYNKNFDENISPADIQCLNPEELPDFNVFCGGFPCQPFSIAGKREGLEDERGKLINSILRICGAKKPEVIFLENVANLKRLNSGDTLKWIIKEINNLGYQVFNKVLNSKEFSVPQSRPRLFIIAFRNDLGIYDFEFPHGTSTEVPVKSVFAKGDYSIPISERWDQYIDYYSGKIRAEDLNFKLPKTRVKIERSDPDVNLDDCIYQMRSSGIRALSINRPFPTFAVSVSGGGAMIPVCSKERRHLSVLEIKRLMGFPDAFEFPVARTYAIKQLANSVCPPVISEVGRSIETHLLGESQCLFNRSEIFSSVG